jgi:hypothetical protein
MIYQIYGGYGGREHVNAQAHIYCRIDGRELYLRLMNQMIKKSLPTVIIATTNGNFHCTPSYGTGDRKSPVLIMAII